MHSSTLNEDFCVLIEDGSMDFATAKSRVQGTLYLDNPAEDWDGLAGNKIYFVPYHIPCDQLTADERAATELEYLVNSNGCNGVSCQWFEAYVGSHDGRNDYAKSYQRLKTSHINGGAFGYHHTISHETGHALGLADGDGSCPGSIMHSAAYGCWDIEWPSQGDRDSVTALAG